LIGRSGCDSVIGISCGEPYTAGARAEHDPAHAGGAHLFEQREAANEVDLVVGVRLGHRLTDEAHARAMEHGVDLVLAQRTLELFPVGHVTDGQLCAFRHGLPVATQHRVEHDHLVAGFESSAARWCCRRNLHRR